MFTSILQISGSKEELLTLIVLDAFLLERGIGNNGQLFFEFPLEFGLDLTKRVDYNLGHGGYVCVCVDVKWVGEKVLVS
jgi:hypothetical protein